jgi:hypothetical protein
VPWEFNCRSLATDSTAGSRWQITSNLHLPRMLSAPIPADQVLSSTGRAMCSLSPAGIHPMIVRINDESRAEAFDYRNFQHRPQEAENKYYLSRWAELYFSRNRFTI